MGDWPAVRNCIIVVWPLATLELATMSFHSLSTSACDLPWSSQYLVTFSYQSLSLTSRVILPLYLGSARSSQLCGSWPGLMRSVFQAGWKTLKRLAVQCLNLPVGSTLSSAEPLKSDRMLLSDRAVISRKLVSPTSAPALP